MLTAYERWQTRQALQRPAPPHRRLVPGARGRLRKIGYKEIANARECERLAVLAALRTAAEVGAKR